MARTLPWKGMVRTPASAPFDGFEALDKNRAPISAAFAEKGAQVPRPSKGVYISWAS